MTDVRVVSGSPTTEELAAVIAALLAVQTEQARTERPMRGWSAPTWGDSRVWRPGPRAWRGR